MQGIGVRLRTAAEGPPTATSERASLVSTPTRGEGFQRRLVVEVDGGQHADSEADLPRTRWLEDQGFRILRFWNNEVLSNSGGVLDTIMVAATNPSPGPPFRGAPPSPTRGEGKNERQ